MLVSDHKQAFLVGSSSVYVQRVSVTAASFDKQMVSTPEDSAVSAESSATKQAPGFSSRDE